MPDALGTTIASTPPRSIAAICAFRDVDPLLAALQAEFGVAPPQGPGFVQAGAVMLARLSPTRFLAMSDRDALLPFRLARSLDGLGAITDQSDMWDIRHLSGASVRDTLARLVPIDVHPAHFRIGDFALTRGDHVDVRLWRVGDAGYELAVPRSCSVEFWKARQAVLF